MKKILLSATALSLALTASAFAADLPTKKAPIVPPPPPPTWTGFYVGLNAGGSFSDSTSVNVVSTPVFLNSAPALVPFAGNAAAAAALAGTAFLSNNTGGFLGGGQIGYNYQFGSGLGGFGSAWVAGIEADIQGVSGSGGSQWVASGGPLPTPPFLPGSAIIGLTQATKSLDYIGTVRGRIGFLFTPTFLLYGTGGLAYGGVSSRTTQLSAAIDPTAVLFPTAFTSGWGTAGSYSDTRVGWTAGAGLEWMFAPNWSAKVEYLYYDLGSITYNNGFTGSFTNVVTPGQPLFLNTSWTRARFNGNIIRAGVNYHFNWAAPAPVLAKY